MFRKSDVVEHVDHPGHRYIMFRREQVGGAMIYHASLSVASPDRRALSIVSGPASKFRKLGPDTSRQQAAERVREFLMIRSTMGGIDPDEIAGVGAPGTGEPVPLRTRDLEVLVRAVLGDDTATARPRPVRKGDGLPPGMTWDDVLAAERESADTTDDDGED